MDYLSYAAYSVKKNKNNIPHRSKLSDLRILRHRLPMPQFRDGGGGNYL